MPADEPITPLAPRLLIDGRRSRCVDVFDRGLHYGDGLFETLRLQGGRLRLWQAHMARLAAGCERLGLPFPGEAVLRAEAERVSAGHAAGVVKILLTRGVAGRGYRPPARPRPTRIVLRGDPPAHDATLAERGVRVRFCAQRLGSDPQLAGIKHLNRLPQVLARAEWGDEYHEGLMLDPDGHVIEGTMSNLFFLRDGTLHTPALDQCGVAGVMRAAVLGLAAAEGVPVQRGRYTPEDLLASDGLFLTNAVIGIWPVRELAGRTWETVHPLGRHLQRLVERLA